MHQIKIFFVIACSIFLVLPSDGQTPAPKLGYIRFWNMLPATGGIFEVRKGSGAASEPTMMVAKSHSYSGYAEYPAAKYRLGVHRQGEDRPLKVFDVDLRPNAYLTILVSPRSIDMFDDTIDPEATTGALTIRNFFNGAPVSVSSGAKKIVDPLAYGQSHTAAGLPLSRTPIHVSTRLPTGQSAEAGADIDFKIWKRATMLILTDSYGDFRARVMPDGKNP